MDTLVLASNDHSASPGVSGRINTSDPSSEIRAGWYNVGGFVLRSEARSSTAERSGGGNRALYFFSAALNGDQFASTSSGLFFVDFQCSLRAFLYSLLACCGLGEIIFLQTQPNRSSARKFADRMHHVGIDIFMVLVVVLDVHSLSHVSVASPLTTASRTRIPCS